MAGSPLIIPSFMEEAPEQAVPDYIANNEVTMRIYHIQQRCHERSIPFVAGIGMPDGRYIFFRDIRNTQYASHTFKYLAEMATQSKTFDATLGKLLIQAIGDTYGGHARKYTIPRADGDEELVAELKQRMERLHNMVFGEPLGGWCVFACVEYTHSNRPLNPERLYAFSKRCDNRFPMLTVIKNIFSHGITAETVSNIAMTCETNEGAKCMGDEAMCEEHRIPSFVLMKQLMSMQ